MANHTKKKILDSARDVLSREGSADFSMRKVAAAADMSLGNLQYHFKTKEALFQGLMDQYLSEYEQKHDEYMEEPLNREILSTFIREVLEDEVSDEEGEVYRVLYSFAEASDLSEEIKSSFARKVYGLLFSLLSHTESPASEENIHLACSLLIPYIDSYGYFHDKIGSDLDSLVNLLTDTVGRLLGI